MKKKVFLIIMIAWSTNALGQQSFFLDSLFSFDLSQIESTILEAQRAKIERLKHDWGIAAGINMSNSYQLEVNQGLSTRLFAKANLWNGGYHSNRLDAKRIEHQIMIDSIQGIDRALDHNYGIYFDYIIYLYNIERLDQIDSILLETQKVTAYYRNLYYNKLIDYEELLKLDNAEMQFSILRKSLLTYNTVFKEVVSDTLLPKVSTSTQWNVDFDALAAKIQQDTSEQNILDLEHQILDLQHKKQTSPSLSASLGYDITRNRPFYAVNFSMDINTRKKRDVEVQKLMVSNDIRLQEIQKKKELLNIQYEYRYKEKQLSGLYSKIQSLEEQQRKFNVKNEVLSLERSISERKLKLERQHLNYEITDLKGQLMLLLLRIKKIVHNMDIGPFINKEKAHRFGTKFAGNRFLIKEEGRSFSAFEVLFLEQNEIKMVTPEELIRIQDLMQIDPSIYDTRVDMEKDISTKIKTDGIKNFIIINLHQFKQLELRTLAQKDFDITTFID